MASVVVPGMRKWLTEGSVKSDATDEEDEDVGVEEETLEDEEDDESEDEDELLDEEEEWEDV